MKLKHAQKERGLDFYATPYEAVRALLKAERSLMPNRIWEPACGDGAIVLPLREAGYRVVATDLVDRGCPDAEAGVDFLMEPKPRLCSGIITNPPYCLAGGFVERALALAPYVVMLLPLTFLASMRRKPMFERYPLARLHVFSRRLPMMHRHGWNGPKTSSSKDYAWFVWDSTASLGTRIHCVDWKEC